MSFIESLHGASVLVFGAGVTGKPTVEFLTAHGAQVFVVDEKGEEVGALHSLDTIELSGLSYAVVSPGWRIDHPMIDQVRQASIEIISEIDLAWRVKCERRPDQRWIALTGTNGKTTTVQMAEAMLRHDGRRALACGNVGTTAIEAVWREDVDILVLELSSFQLEWSNEAHFEAAAILNIAEDHIDWHGSFDNYAQSKFRIASRAARAILYKSDPEISRRARDLTIPVTFFSLDVPLNHEVGLVENLIVDREFIVDEAEALFELGDVTPAVPHNVLNAMAAASLVRSLGVSADAIASALREFRLDHHRLETVAVHNGISWIDDSKATNPHAALAALQSQIRSIWIAGGLAKGAAMDDLISSARTRIKSAILIGRDAPIIESALKKCAPEIPYHIVDPSLRGFAVMQAAVEVAKSEARDGDVVLLAPACASMDQFRNYAERGEFFARAVKEVVYGK